jgi:hypothetical protein
MVSCLLATETTCCGQLKGDTDEIDASEGFDLGRFCTILDSLGFVLYVEVVDFEVNLWN